ncbi:MAG TPA: serine hydrolase [Nocardioidaceae bacterium]|nr:serine hydrolase [Nocardioidaceae bacterium]
MTTAAETGFRLPRDTAGRIEARVASFCRTGGEDASVSVWVCGLETREPAYAREAESDHYAASTMKLPLLVAAYRRHERGELDLDRPVPVHNDFRSALDGTPYSMRQDYDQDDETWEAIGEELALRELARRAIVQSGNLATNLLLERVGAGEVATVLTDAGCSGKTLLPRGIEDFAAREGGLENRVTAADLGRLMHALARGELAEPETCASAERVLAAQEHRERIPAGLPDGTYCANKTGWVDRVNHDVGLVRPERGAAYVLAVCTTGDAGKEAATLLIADVSRLVWKAGGLDRTLG